MSRLTHYYIVRDRISLKSQGPLEHSFKFVQKHLMTWALERKLISSGVN